MNGSVLVAANREHWNQSGSNAVNRPSRIGPLGEIGNVRSPLLNKQQQIDCCRRRLVQFGKDRSHRTGSVPPNFQATLTLSTYR